jgi:hypothetical protein
MIKEAYVKRRIAGVQRRPRSLRKIRQGREGCLILRGVHLTQNQGVRLGIGVFGTFQVLAASWTPPSHLGNLHCGLI